MYKDIYLYTFIYVWVCGCIRARLKLSQFIHMKMLIFACQSSCQSCRSSVSCNQLGTKTFSSLPSLLLRMCGIFNIYAVLNFFCSLSIFRCYIQTKGQIHSLIFSFLRAHVMNNQSTYNFSKLQDLFEETRKGHFCYASC